VVWKQDFFNLAPGWKGQFDVVIGNPPWAGRGSKQVAHKFMEAAPDLLTARGRACLLLPSKVFLNQTDTFQSTWLNRVTLEKVVQLADYRRILFQAAKCPCNIACFTKHAPPDDHEIEYVTPKVSRADLREGVVPIGPQDRKWIPLRLVRHAAEQRVSGAVWKSYLWGTPCDLRLLDYLSTLPKLRVLAGTVSQMQRGKKRWCKGDGFQPLRATSKTDIPKSLIWPTTDRFVAPSTLAGVLYVPPGLLPQVGAYLREKGYRLDKMHRPREERIYQPPLVLFNKGFTDAAFFNYHVRYQDALRGLAAAEQDRNYLLFLAAYLRSPLARYFVFHTAGSLAAERDQVHLPEVLQLPFFLPDAPEAVPAACALVDQIASRVARLVEEMDESGAALLRKLKSGSLGPLFGDEDGSGTTAFSEWFCQQREKTHELQEELNPLIYKYFGLNDHEIALIETTCQVIDRSDTPPSLEAAKGMPTLEPVLEATRLRPYAQMLVDTLNGWISGRLRVSAEGGVDAHLGLAMVNLTQTREARPFEPKSTDNALAFALRRLQSASAEAHGQLTYLRGAWFFDGPHIYIVKPALLGYWTRTAALNDAADLYAHVADAKRRLKPA
jgi:hypothetical protein